MFPRNRLDRHPSFAQFRANLRLLKERSNTLHRESGFLTSIMSIPVYPALQNQADAEDFAQVHHTLLEHVRAAQKHVVLDNFINQVERLIDGFVRPTVIRDEQGAYKKLIYDLWWLLRTTMEINQQLLEPLRDERRPAANAITDVGYLFALIAVPQISTVVLGYAGVKMIKWCFGLNETSSDSWLKLLALRKDLLVLVNESDVDLAPELQSEHEARPS